MMNRPNDARQIATRLEERILSEEAFWLNFTAVEEISIFINGMNRIHVDTPPTLTPGATSEIEYLRPPENYGVANRNAKTESVKVMRWHQLERPTGTTVDSRAMKGREDMAKEKR